MARTKISEFSATAADNTDIDSIDIAEGCAPSGINNAIRELMAQLKDMQTGASGDTFTLTTVNSTTMDTTNLEVTNLKAKDGTAAGSIANSTGVVTLASAVLTTADINGGTVDGATIGGTTPAAATFTSGVISANSSSNALRITQTGAGNALLVEDSANPDSTPFVVTADGTVIRGYTSPVVTDNYAGTQGTPLLQTHANATTASGLASFVWESTAVSPAPSVILSRSRSATIGSFSSVASGDAIGAINFNGDDGTAFVVGASIASYVDGTPGTNDMPGRLVFSTTADGASSPTERMRISSTGKITDQYGNIRAVTKSGAAKTTSYTLLATDVGQFIEIGSGGSVTIPNATFSAGDAVSLFNNTSGNITVTCSITTAYIGGADSDKATVTLATRGVATILFVSGTVCVINGNVT